MKQIALILLFIFTLQKKLNTDSPKDLPKNQHLKRTSPYPIPANADCPRGYLKLCFGRGKYEIFKNLPNPCYCYEKKVQKINRILKEVTTAKDKTIKDRDKPIKDRLTKNKYFPLVKRKIISIKKNSPLCNGDYLVCYEYEYPNRKMSKCECTKNPYLPF